jgi:hypothetical protein
MPGVGLEPTRIAPADFKSAASACSATPASSRGYSSAFGMERQVVSQNLGIKWRRRPDSNRCIGVLQTPALTTWLRRLKILERKTRFELATSSLARRHSTAELLPPKLVFWCRGGDLNSYELTLTTPSRWRVYQLPPPRHCLVFLPFPLFLPGGRLFRRGLLTLFPPAHG